MARIGRAAAHRRPRARRRRAAPRRALRGALPPDRRLLHRHEAAGQAGPGAGPRPRACCLLDEPTNGLDPAGRDDMLALIHRIGTEFGITVRGLLPPAGRAGAHLRPRDRHRRRQAAARLDRSPTSPQATHVLIVEVAEGTDELAGHDCGQTGAPAGAARRTPSCRWSWPATRPTTSFAARSPNWTSPLHSLEQRRHRGRRTVRHEPGTGSAEAAGLAHGGQSCRLSAKGVIHDIGYQPLRRPAGWAAGRRHRRSSAAQPAHRVRARAAPARRRSCR